MPKLEIARINKVNTYQPLFFISYFGSYLNLNFVHPSFIFGLKNMHFW